ncbi:hypothetical protein [Sphingomonas radiodurans]|uniref:hypothetical protein n=1 Tax=Sphingomonas radiodurans TaxID=2890321 RepID=UPI001E52737E|nr:hypothetical protein [Sphingomonas radiodurans]WBH17369.1 hypothetical protein LLW23_04470 [Sphingomonas radiodurans]
MPDFTRLVLPLALAAPFVVSARTPEDGVRYAQMTYRERVVIRIPRLPLAPRRQAPAITNWDEHKAPKCVAAASLASAAITASGDVDLIVTDGRRLRAKLDDDCPTLNFYTGFYLKRSADGMVCAGRDALRSRSGARCEIDRFRTLTARK